MLLKRERCLEKICPFYDLDIIKVLVGSRRAGKSKVLELIINELKERGVDEQDILYMNFENLDFEEISDYKKLNTYVKEHKETNKQYLFFDEIQHVSGFEEAINSFRYLLIALYLLLVQIPKCCHLKYLHYFRER